MTDMGEVAYTLEPWQRLNVLCLRQRRHIRVSAHEQKPF